MGLFGRKQEYVPPHPRREPRIPLPLNLESLKQVFRDSVDFSHRELALAGDGEKRITLCYISGMVKMERVSDYVLRPMAQDGALAACPDMDAVMAKMQEGALYNLGVEERDTMDAAVADPSAATACCSFPGKPPPCPSTWAPRRSAPSASPATRRCSRAPGTPSWSPSAPTPAYAAAT